MNIFRVLGDLSHTASKIILIAVIHQNRSAEGVSLLTQILYTLVFGSRYLDLFWVSPRWNWWNFVLKLFYISTSLYVVFVMMKVVPRTREKEGAWKITIWSLVGCAVSAPLVVLLFEGKFGFRFGEIFWAFSIELESICVLPQLLLLRQTSVPTVLNSGYLVTLGSYRFFYILNWIVRGATEHYFEPIAVIFGIVQTLLYIDFAWVYYSRQRVKLRGGGVVDSDDLSKSLLVRRFIGKRRSGDDADSAADEEEGFAEQESGTVRPQRPNWGARGISVSADDTLERHDGARDGSATDIQDPSAFADEDDEEEDKADNGKEGGVERRSSPFEDAGEATNESAQWADSAHDRRERDGE